MKPTEAQLANREQWLTALESGNYLRGKGKLCSTTIDGKEEFCCLGVDAHVAGIEHRPPLAQTGSHAFYFNLDGSDTKDLKAGYPPDQWFAARHGLSVAASRRIQETAAALNDGMAIKSFSEIAVRIRELFAQADAGKWD